MKYNIQRNEKYDFIGQTYSSSYPNLHKYPATMLPQIGSSILKELNISNGTLLDPYCGSGSSFMSGLECGITKMFGFDINPLAILISKVKFTKISPKYLLEEKINFREDLFEFLKDESNLKKLIIPKITNIDFWFSEIVIQNLNIIKHFIYRIKDENIQRFFLIPFSETVKESSFSRNNEFKLFKMKSEDIINFNPDVIGIFFKKLEDTLINYSKYYYPKLKDVEVIDVQFSKFEPKLDKYDIVLTSPPYGDSRTTVAYGQFSTLSNEWLGVDYARKIDSMLMGGIKSKTILTKGLISDYINSIAKEDKNRALEVSSFYDDLSISIKNVAYSVNIGGKVIYVVGNRTVKNIQLPTDQFIAEKFEENGFKHLITYERALSNKAMPLKNSPTNKTGMKVNTMLYEYIVICEKTENKNII